MSKSSTQLIFHDDSNLSYPHPYGIEVDVMFDDNNELVIKKSGEKNYINIENWFEKFKNIKTPNTLIVFDLVSKYNPNKELNKFLDESILLEEKIGNFISENKIANTLILGLNVKYLAEGYIDLIENKNYLIRVDNNCDKNDLNKLQNSTSSNLLIWVELSDSGLGINLQTLKELSEKGFKFCVPCPSIYGQDTKLKIPDIQNILLESELKSDFILTKGECINSWKNWLNNFEHVQEKKAAQTSMHAMY